MDDSSYRPQKSFFRSILEMVMLLAVVAVSGGLGWFIGRGKSGESEKLETRLAESLTRIQQLDQDRTSLREDLEKARAEASQKMGGDVERLLATKEAEWKKELNRVRIESEIEKVKRVEVLERELNLLKMDERMRAEMATKGGDVVDLPAGVAKGLTPRARQVCAKLLELEGLSADELEKKSGEIAQQLGARSLVRVVFGSGSAHVGSDDETALRVAVADTQEYSLLLAVGFADKGGDSESNRELGSKRAQNVADTMESMMQRGQMVESVYLGETDRFGANRANNRAVEVWELRR